MFAGFALIPSRMSDAVSTHRKDGELYTMHSGMSFSFSASPENDDKKLAYR